LHTAADLPQEHKLAESEDPESTLRSAEARAREYEQRLQTAEAAGGRAMPPEAAGQLRALLLSQRPKLQGIVCCRPLVVLISWHPVEVAERRAALQAARKRLAQFSAGLECH
jgi:hypothetical protein